MQESVARILILMASGRVLSSDFEAFVEYVQSSNAEDVSRHYQKLRSGVRRLSLDRTTSEGDNPARPTAGSGGGLRLPVYRQVTSLLEEANLTSRDGAEALLAELDGSSEIKLPRYDPKVGLQRWLKQIHSIVGASKLLMAATVVSNGNREAPHHGWPLKNS